MVRKVFSCLVFLFCYYPLESGILLKFYGYLLLANKLPNISMEEVCVFALE